MRSLLLGAAVLCLGATAALAQGELNIYSSRHYDTDDSFYDNFTEETGITINRIEDDADILIERMRSEGELGAADLLITVDAGRLMRADADGLFQPFGVDAVDERVPASLRAANDHWAAISTRARLIFVDNRDVPEPPRTYAELADPKWQGKICTRSSSNVYMLGLLSSIIAREGEEAARAWAQGVKNNLARDPAGGDTDQLRALVSGECDVALANDYYYLRAQGGEVEGLTDSIDLIGVVFPNQETTGAHLNVSGFGIAANAPNVENARRFVTYMLGAEAQKLIADGNYEFPVSEDVVPTDVAVALGTFRRDDIALEKFGGLNDVAQRIYNEVGYK